MSLMKGKKGLIMGVANERSIAWGISQSIDLAKLSHGLLSGEELTNFIKRSFDIIK